MPAMRHTDTGQALIIFLMQALLDVCCTSSEASSRVAKPSVALYQVVRTGSIGGGTVRRYTNRYNPRELSLFVGREQEGRVVIPNYLAHVIADIGVTIQYAMDGIGQRCSQF